jgi:hypothetical protein
LVASVSALSSAAAAFFTPFSADATSFSPPPALAVSRTVVASASANLSSATRSLAAEAAKRASAAFSVAFADEPTAGASTAAMAGAMIAGGVTENAVSWSGVGEPESSAAAASELRDAAAARLTVRTVAPACGGVFMITLSACRSYSSVMRSSGLARGKCTPE